MWILALDVGTSSIRAIGYDALGRPLPGADARASCEPTVTSDGGSELVAVVPDSHGLTALLFLAGERSPGWRRDARAAVTGISLATTAPQILRALLEAVAYRLAAVYDRLAPVASPGHAVVASGGALGHSGVFTQVLADALGVPLDVREGTEPSSRGAALLALGALGRPAPPPEASGSLVRPDPRRHDVYAAARARQGRLYDSVVGPRVS